MAKRVISPFIINHVQLTSDSCLKEYGFCSDHEWQAGYFNSTLYPSGIDDPDPAHSHWVNIDVVDQENINYLKLIPVYLALQ